MKYKIGDLLLITKLGKPCIRKVINIDNDEGDTYVFHDCYRKANDCILLDDALKVSVKANCVDVIPPFKEVLQSLLVEAELLIYKVNKNIGGRKVIVLCDHQEIDILSIVSVKNEIVNYECFDGTYSNVHIGNIKSILVEDVKQ
jgi:hypothetical protein